MASKKSKEERERRKAQRKKEQEDQHEKAKSWLREWGDALLFAFVAALIIRTFFFEAYRIPTPSMEKTLMTGDFLVVSKINYGPRTPMTLGVPFTNIYVPGVNIPWARIPGYDTIERNDIVVFNYPVDIAPISAKTNYIKRLVGTPGDTLSIRDKEVYVNGDPNEDFDTIQQHYRVSVEDRVRLSSSKVRSAGARLVREEESNVYRVNMTEEVAEEMEGWSEVNGVEPLVLPEDYNEYSQVRFSFSSGFVNHDHMPETVIPFEGQEVTLTEDNWHIYKDIVERYERNSVEQDGDTFVINGEETETYTIQKDYYFMMGDNRDDSEDSRYWGFVPDDHIVGKAGMIYFSWDGERWMPRFERLLNFIHD